MAKAKPSTTHPQATAKADPSTEVVKTNSNAVVAMSAADFAADSGAGFEEATSDSFAIPFLVVLQKGSPQVDEEDGAFIEGAKPGMVLNNVNNRLYDGKGGIFIVPCHYQRQFLRWGAREGGSGGFKGALAIEEVTKLRQEGKIKDLDGGLFFPLADGTVNPKACDRIGDHRNHFVLVQEEDGNLSPALLSLTSTQIKKSKQLMSMLNDVRVQSGDSKVPAPAFANKVKLTTVGESNDKGSWHGVKFELAGFVDHATYKEGKAFYQNVKKGNVEAKYEDVQEAPAGGRAHDDPNGAF